MGRAYASFLLRCWRLDRGERRVTVEHIQSGERVAVASVAAAAEWICARDGATAPAPPAKSDHEEVLHGTEGEGRADE